MRITIRPSSPSDHNFIYKTYLLNRWYSKENLTTLKKDTWIKMQHKRLETILNNEVVLIACSSEDPDYIVGYSLMDGPRPWTYVKKAWRSPDLAIEEKLLKEIE